MPSHKQIIASRLKKIFKKNIILFLLTGMCDMSQSIYETHRLRRQFLNDQGTIDDPGWVTRDGSPRRDTTREA